MKRILFVTGLYMTLSTNAIAMESSAKISESTAEEVEMELAAEKDIVIRNAQPDARLYLLSGGAVVTANMQKAFEILKTDTKNTEKSGYELALEIFNK